MRNLFRLLMQLQVVLWQSILSLGRSWIPWKEITSYKCVCRRERGKGSVRQACGVITQGRQEYLLTNFFLLFFSVCCRVKPFCVSWWFWMPQCYKSVQVQIHAAQVGQTEQNCGSTLTAYQQHFYRLEEGLEGQRVKAHECLPLIPALRGSSSHSSSCTHPHAEVPPAASLSLQTEAKAQGLGQTAALNSPLLNTHRAKSRRGFTASHSSTRRAIFLSLLPLRILDSRLPLPLSPMEKWEARACTHAAPRDTAEVRPWWRGSCGIALPPRCSTVPAWPLNTHVMEAGGARAPACAAAIWGGVPASDQVKLPFQYPNRAMWEERTQPWRDAAFCTQIMRQEKSRRADMPLPSQWDTHASFSSFLQGHSTATDRTPSQTGRENSGSHKLRLVFGNLASFITAASCICAFCKAFKIQNSLLVNEYLSNSEAVLKYL